MKPYWCNFGHHYSASLHPVQQRRAHKSEHNLTFQVMKEVAPAPKQTLQDADTVRQRAGSGISAEHLTAIEGQLLLQLPQVQSLQQAKQQSDALQLQAYKKTRKLQGMVATLCSCNCHLATHAWSRQKCTFYTFCDWGGFVSWLLVAVQSYLIYHWMSSISLLHSHPLIV